MRFLPAALLVALLAVPAFVRSADPPKAKDAPSADELAADLASASFAAREKAQRALWQLGKDAIPALEKVARGDDPEASRRAQGVLDRFGWGDLPDTPPDVLKLIRKFQAGDPNFARSEALRREAIGDLMKLGRPGIAAVRAILTRNLPPESRTRLINSVTAQVRREVPLLLVAGKTADADELMSLHAAGTTADGAADYAAYHVLRGDLPAAIAQAELALKAGGKGEPAKLVLVYLYRAAGLWARARETGEDVTVAPETPTYTEVLLEDEGNWAALADLNPGRELNHPDAVRIMLARLAGRTEKFDEAVKKVRADAAEFNDAYDVKDAAVALLAGNRAADAADLLTKKRNNLDILSEIQIARMKFKEATELLDGKAEVQPEERLEFDLRRARVLMTAGKREDASKLFGEVARGLRAIDGGDRGYLSRPARSLIRTEARVGLRDLACEHAAMFVPPNVPAGSTTAGESVFELLFPLDPIAAETLFQALRRAGVPGDQPGASMARTRDLLNGTASGPAVDEAVRVLRESAALTGPNAGLAKARSVFALAMILRAAKRADEAEAAFKLAAELTAGSDGAATAPGARSWVYGAPDPARVWIEWGDYLMELGRPRAAAAVFEAGWKLFPDQPLPMLLWGRALVAAGDVKEGQQRVELTHWVSLGNEKVRGRFLDELIRRGEGKAIRREVSLIAKACWSHSHMFGNVMNQCARGSFLVGDFATAEVCGQRSLLVVMRKPGIYFVDPVGYLNVPHEILAFRARAQLTAGKADEAVATARDVLSVTPGYMELVTGIVPELDRLGRKADADALFAVAWDAYEKVLKDYPEGASARGSLAQLSGHCNRRLDEGLKHAKAAVASDPQSVGYREWLAEVHFRRGERAAAVKVMERLIDEHPRTFLYGRQLTRYRSAPLDSPWPHTAD